MRTYDALASLKKVMQQITVSNELNNISLVLVDGIF